MLGLTRNRISGSMIRGQWRDCLALGWIHRWYMAVVRLSRLASCCRRGEAAADGTIATAREHTSCAIRWGKSGHHTERTALSSLHGGWKGVFIDFL
jgi:hypothetical protein